MSVVGVTLAEMMRPLLSDDTALDVRLSALCARAQFTNEPGPVLEELYATAGERLDILAVVAGRWIGYYETDPHHEVLVDALRTIPGVEPHVETGRFRRRAARPSTIPPSFSD